MVHRMEAVMPKGNPLYSRDLLLDSGIKFQCTYSEYREKYEEFIRLAEEYIKLSDEKPGIFCMSNYTDEDGNVVFFSFPEYLRDCYLLVGDMENASRIYEKYIHDDIDDRHDKYGRYVRTDRGYIMNGSREGRADVEVVYDEGRPIKYSRESEFYDLPPNEKWGEIEKSLLVELLYDEGRLVKKTVLYTYLDGSQEKREVVYSYRGDGTYEADDYKNGVIEGRTIRQMDEQGWERLDWEDEGWCD